jgi:putative phosphoribosyl transferase
VRYADRREAGRDLARALRGHVAGQDAVILGLPRGGVPVAYEVAMALGAPLDVFLVRKLGVPGYEELAMGAIASGGVRVINVEVVMRLGIDDETIEEVAAHELEELYRRERLYRDGRPPPELAGRTAVLVDDGLATGSTMRAAAAALRQTRAARTIAAAPVGAAATCRSLRDVADEVVCAQAPQDFVAVGVWYEDFRQTTDEEVCELLARASAARRERSADAAAGR